MIAVHLKSYSHKVKQDLERVLWYATGDPVKFISRVITNGTRRGPLSVRVFCHCHFFCCYLSRSSKYPEMCPPHIYHTYPTQSGILPPARGKSPALLPRETSSPLPPHQRSSASALAPHPSPALSSTSPLPARRSDP